MRLTPLPAPSGTTIDTRSRLDAGCDAAYRDSPSPRTDTAPLTALERAQAELAASERRFRAVQESSVDGFMMLDAVREDGAIVDFEWRYANAAAERIVGRPPGWFVGRRLLAEMPGNRTDGLFDAYVRVVESGEPFTRELSYEHDGVNAHLRLAAVKLDDGFAVTFADRSPQRRVELRLETSERRRSLALQAGRLGTWQYDATTGIFECDEGLAGLFGVPVGDPPALAEAWAGFIHPDDMPRLLSLRDRALATGAALDAEYRIRRADGEERWLAVRGHPKADTTGRVALLVGVTQDITDRKRAELALEAANARLTEATRAGDIGIHEYYPAAERLVWDARMREWWGLRPDDEPTYAGFMERLHPDDRAATQAAVDRALDPASGGRYEAQYRVVGADGGVRWVRATGTVTFDAGHPVRLLGTVQDITSVKSAEQAARSAERRLTQVIDSMFAFVGVLTPDGTLVEVNRAPLAIAGLAREDVIGRPFWDCPWWTHDEAVRVRLREAHARTLANGEAVRYDETIRVAGEGGRDARMVIDFMLQPVVEDGRIAWLVPSGVDVDARVTTERALEDANARLRAADRRKDEFLATLSHELRNPLAPIRSAARILAHPRLADDQLVWARQVIQRQVGQLSALLDDLLDVARITQGKLELKRERVGLAPVVDTAVEAVRPLFDRKRQRLTVTLPASDPSLDADALRLAQILSNLLTNAAKYTDEGGDVSLSAAVEGPELRLEVRDNGIGIPAGALQTLFTLFGQVEGTRGRSEGGLGIGLALVKGLAELHGGTASADSHGPGLGSTFTVRLPIVRAAEPATSPAATRAPTVGRRILVVDDNRDAADTLAMLLGLAGHELRVAYAGRAALALARTFRPEIALLDLGLPDLDGCALATALRREPWSRGLRLIALTGWGQSEDRERSRAAGFDVHLTKPVDTEQLEALVAAPPPGTRDEAGAR